MNQFVPDWSSNMGDAFAPLGGEDDGLIELLWCNGHVVMQSQAPRKPPRPEKVAAAAAAAVMQEDEAAPWFQYAVDDLLEKDLFSELFGEMPAAADAAGKACKEECGALVGSAVTAPQSRLMPPPRPAAHVAREKACLGDVDDVRAVSEVLMAQTAGEGAAATEAGESSMLTIGSSICGSNQVQTPGGAPTRAVSDTAGDSALLPPGNGKAGAARARHDATTLTSSSMRSRSCAAKTEAPGAANRGGGKRKQRDTMESGSPSEDVEFESAAVTCEPAQKLTTAKRRCAAEVHNLSERRRRDRINEKMKALQELIPHCNKTDKASMLDEAIEYLKSLQLQLQMMWMGGGMALAPVMFPAGVHQYMQRMGVGMGPLHMASMTRMPPFMAPPAVQSSPVSHMPVAASMVDPYARCLAVEHLQPPSPMVVPCSRSDSCINVTERFQQHYLQGMSFYQLGAATNLQQNPAPPVVPGGSLPTARTLPPDNILHKKYENCSKPEMKGIIS